MKYWRILLGEMLSLFPMEEQTPKAFHSTKLLRRFIDEYHKLRP